MGWLDKHQFDEGLERLIHKYKIGCIHISDNVGLPGIGECSIYLPIDLRSEEEKQKKDFDDYIFENIDASIINGAQFNSVLLTREEIEKLSKKTLKIKWDAQNIQKKPVENGFIYEVIAINTPFADDSSAFVSSFSNANKCH